ncbi:MAG: hypothetical protein L3J56_01475 [Bacteroidales bacterium]|nr:hypothetical protein [Bacteroidales bacterium]
MNKKNLDPIGKLMGLRYKSHPWHGIEIGEDAPEVLTCFIEMVPMGDAEIIRLQNEEHHAYMQ